MANLVKIGYARLVNETTTNYISYSELNGRDDKYMDNLRLLLNSKKVKLYCACCQDNDFELTVTANNVIRVKNNGKSQYHEESCPKSEQYKEWLRKHEHGVEKDESGKITLNISLPSIKRDTIIKVVEEEEDDKTKSPGDNDTSTKTESTDEENKEKKERNYKTTLHDMIYSINAIAWEKQTFSVKKEISIALKNKVPPAWNYKDNYEFTRLVFGVTNSININHRGNTYSLNDICYRSDKFFNSQINWNHWFIYTEIINIPEIKPDWKYQYITVKMPSNVSKSKATIRVQTQDFKDLFEDFKEIKDGHRMIAGYVYHTRYTKEDKSVVDWINLIKGEVFYVSANGLYATDQYEVDLINMLSKNHLLFKKPYESLQSYGNEKPTLLIERYNMKNKIIDVCRSTKELNKRTTLAKNTKEYDCTILNGVDLPELKSLI